MNITLSSTSDLPTDRIEITLEKTATKKCGFSFQEDNNVEYTVHCK